MNTSIVKIPTERLQQLQSLAEKDGVSVSDTIADLVRKAIFDGRLSDTLPGWKVERVGDLVHFEHFESGIAKRWTPTVAVSVAAYLDKLSKAGAASKAVLDLDAGLEFGRVGVSVKITDLDSKASRAVARSIATDIAHLIRRAAA